MGRSHVSRRQQERAIRLYKRTAGRLVYETAARLEIELSPDEWLALRDELVALADPRALDGSWRTPLPAGRHDLIRRFLSWRMLMSRTDEEVVEYLRMLRITSAGDPPRMLRRFGDPTSKDVFDAYSYRHLRQPRREGKRYNLH